MYNFNKRIKKLLDSIGKLPPKVRIIYADGSQEIIDDGGTAISACVNKKAIKVERVGTDTDDGWIDILQSICDTDFDELWKSGCDTPL